MVFLLMPSGAPGDMSADVACFLPLSGTVCTQSRIHQIFRELERSTSYSRKTINVHSQEVPCRALQKIIFTWDEAKIYIQYQATLHLLEGEEGAGQTYCLWQHIKKQAKVEIQNQSEVPLFLHIQRKKLPAQRLLLQPHSNVRLNRDRWASCPFVTVPNWADIPTSRTQLLGHIDSKELIHPPKTQYHRLALGKVRCLLIQEDQFEGLQIAYQVTEKIEGEEGEVHSCMIQNQSRIQIHKNTHQLHIVITFSDERSAVAIVENSSEQIAPIMVRNRTFHPLSFSRPEKIFQITLQNQAHVPCVVITNSDAMTASAAAR